MLMQRPCVRWRPRGALCIAHKRPNEIKLHPPGATRNGITKTELRELCLYSFLYRGGPASLDAYHTIKAALTESERIERVTRKKRR